MKDLYEDSDEELMRKYQLGDGAAFNVLYERYANRLYGFLINKTKNKTLSSDVFQRTFLKLHQYRSRYDSKYPFLPWIFSICRNELNSTYRQIKKSEEAALEVERSSTNEREASIVFDIQESNLTLNQKEALLMRFQDEASFEEIAAKLDTTGANARKIISRALQQIRRFYGKS